MLIVSNYHYIRTDFNSPYPSIFGVTPVQFKNQLMQLGKMGAFVHPKELVSNPEFYINSKEPFVLITFDDGLKEQFELAKPILEDLGIGALFFVNTANILDRDVSLVHQIHLLRSVLPSKELLGVLQENESIVLTPIEIKKAQQHYNYDNPEAAELKYLLNFKMTYKEQEQWITPLFQQYFDSEAVNTSLYMNDAILSSLSQKGQLGSHAHRHVPLGLLSQTDLNNELQQSKQLLEDLVQQEIITISYPYGNPEACTKEVAEAAATAGYELGFTMTRKGNNQTTERLLLNRFDCNDLPGGKNEKTGPLCELRY